MQGWAGHGLTREQHLFSGRLCEVGDCRGLIFAGCPMPPFKAGAAAGLQIRRALPLTTDSIAGQANITIQVFRASCVPWKNLRA